MYALFDADVLVFRAGFAAERKEWHLGWGPTGVAGWENHKVFEYKREAMDHLDKVLPGVYSREEGKDYSMWPEVNLEPVSHALHNVKVSVERALEACDCTDFDVKMYLSGKDNFRNDVAVTRPYKGNRDRSHRPTHEKAIRAYIKANWDTTEAHGEEADDLLGIAQTKYGPEDSIIISIDKDLDQIPGLKYNFMHDVRYNVDRQKANYNFYMQLLTGDSTDNIPGLPGIGPGKAAKALHGMEASESDMIAECCRMYQIHSGMEDWEKYMLEQGRLLWIRREVGQMWELPIIPQEDIWDQMDLTMEID